MDIYICLSFYHLSRFVLEPKSVLVNEQEQKLKDSESAIGSLQIAVVESDSDQACGSIQFEANLIELLTELKGVHGKTAGGGGEQLEGAAATRSRPRSSDNVDERVISL
ncbi:hypothetical protein Goari_009935 [Gossypium aridum]|uniref:Uncharacterized protein n=1 Tax=Gossypium aridum TaxID=34290 RepID=A0A7J8XYG7_GOSAI|nr:hypothetical protein [Gossypium aridum]